MSEISEHNKQPLDNSTLQDDVNGAFSYDGVSKNEDPSEIEIIQESSSGLLDFLWYLLKVCIAAFLIYTFVVQPIVVSGNSMNDCLQDKDRLFLEKISVRTHHLSRFDIIVFQTDADDHDGYFIKRIIGLPGETVQVKDGCIYIDGNLLQEDYGKETMEDAGIAAEKILLGESEYFVLGDNRNDSKDSRYFAVGPVDEEKILGRVIARFWPLQSFKIY